MEGLKRSIAAVLFLVIVFGHGFLSEASFDTRIDDCFDSETCSFRLTEEDETACRSECCSKFGNFI